MSDKQEIKHIIESTDIICEFLYYLSSGIPLTRERVDCIQMAQVSYHQRARLRHVTVECMLSCPIWQGKTDMLDLSEYSCFCLWPRHCLQTGACPWVRHSILLNQTYQFKDYQEFRSIIWLIKHSLYLRNYLATTWKWLSVLFVKDDLRKRKPSVWTKLII